MSYTKQDYDDINVKIEATQFELNRNERLQDNYIAKFGKENTGLAEMHEYLCDKMQELIRKRNEIAKDVV